MIGTSVPRLRNDSSHDALAHAADRVGATASLLCALHCAALPLLLTVLPALGLGFLADHRFERVFIAFASALALTTLIRGYRRHRMPGALYLLAPGLILLWSGAWVFDTESSPVVHAALVTVGGSCVALAHVANMRLTHLFGACCVPGRDSAA